MNRRNRTVHRLAAGLAGLVCGIAAADVSRIPNPTPDPVPPPPLPCDMSRFGEGPRPTRGVENPPEIYKDRDDRKRTVMHNFELAPGEKIFYPSGRNEPITILDQSIGMIDPAAPTLIQRFNGTANNEWTPADPDVAVGNGYVVHVINDDYSVFDKCGNQVFTRDANDLFGLDTSYQFYDPKICFDPWNQRWIMLWHVKRTSDQFGRLFLAISANNTPIALTGSGWQFYQFNFVQDAGTGDASFPDYYDLGYSADHVFVGGDQFRFSGSFRWSRATIWVKSEIYNFATAFSSNHFNFNNPDGSQMRLPRAVKCQLDFGSQDATFVNSRRTGGNRITKWFVTAPFGANTRTAVDIAVADYDLPPSALQPNGAALDTIDCRLMTAVQTRDNGGAGGDALYTGLQEANLWAGDTVNRAACRLYRFNPNNNAVDLDRLFGGPNLYYWFPSIAADYNNNAYWTFTRGGPGEFMNARVVDMNNGTFTNSSTQIQAGSGNSAGSRWGDYFGGSLDWDDFFNGAAGTRVWLTGMFGVSGTWDTTIGAVSNFTRGTLSVTPATDMTVSGDSGGLFANTQVYIASNTGQTGLTYNVTDDRTWITTSRTTNNQLYTGTQNTTVTVNVAQPVGTYTGTVTFDDCALSGATTTRNVTLIVRPANNSCGRATAIGTGSRTVNNILADGTDITTCALNDSKDVWYRFVARCNGTVQVDTLDTALNTDSTLAVFTECNGTQIDCNDDFGGSFRSRVRFNVVANEDYYIRLAGYNGLEGTWTMFLGYTHDYNRDGTTDFFDYLDFVDDFAARRAAADYNTDGGIDFFDYLDFVADFAAAC